MTKYEEDTRKFESIAGYKVKCKCSHTIVMAKVDRLICNHCGRWVYRNKNIEFRYKMLERLKK